MQIADKMGLLHLLHAALCLVLVQVAPVAALGNSTATESAGLGSTQIALISVAIGCVVICWGMKRAGGGRGILGAARWRVKGDRRRVHARAADGGDDQRGNDGNVGGDGA